MVFGRVAFGSRWVLLWLFDIYVISFCLISGVFRALSLGSEDFLIIKTVSCFHESFRDFWRLFLFSRRLKVKLEEYGNGFVVFTLRAVFFDSCQLPSSTTSSSPPQRHHHFPIFIYFTLSQIPSVSCNIGSNTLPHLQPLFPFWRALLGTKGTIIGRSIYWHLVTF